MAKVVAMPQKRLVLSEDMMKNYAGMFDMVERDVKLQKGGRTS